MRGYPHQTTHPWIRRDWNLWFSVWHCKILQQTTHPWIRRDWNFEEWLNVGGKNADNTPLNKKGLKRHLRRVIPLCSYPDNTPLNKKGLKLAPFKRLGWMNHQTTHPWIRRDWNVTVAVSDSWVTIPDNTPLNKKGLKRYSRRTRKPEFRIQTTHPWIRRDWNLLLGLIAF